MPTERNAKKKKKKTEHPVFEHRVCKTKHLSRHTRTGDKRLSACTNITQERSAICMAKFPGLDDTYNTTVLCFRKLFPIILNIVPFPRVGSYSLLISLRSSTHNAFKLGSELRLLYQLEDSVVCTPR